MPVELNHFIGGKKVPGKSGRLGEIFNPATGELAAKVPLASAEEVNAAVAVAKAALTDWAGAPPIRRARVMFKFRELIERHMDELGRIITAEHGKILSDAKGSVTRGLEVVEFACGIPQLLKGEFSEQVGSGIDSW